MTRLANVKRLKVHFLGAPRENRLKMDMILKRYADGEVNNYKTGECNDSSESSWLVRPPQGSTTVSENDGNQDRETNARQTEAEFYA